jgi:DNA-binding transcriptional ArsR family regulator
LPEATDLLENFTFMEILLSIISGKDYSSAIAKTLKKSQPTVTEQLKKLEATQLIKPLSRKKAQAYEINWDLLFDIFYNLVYRVASLREEYFENADKITRSNLEAIVTRDLFKAFLRSYFSCFRDLGGQKKGFDEIVFSFFDAFERLSKKDRNKIINEFGLDEENFTNIAKIVSFEISAVEEVAWADLMKSKEASAKTES